MLLRIELHPEQNHGFRNRGHAMPFTEQDYPSEGLRSWPLVWKAENYGDCYGK